MSGPDDKGGEKPAAGQPMGTQPMGIRPDAPTQRPHAGMKGYSRPPKNSDAADSEPDDRARGQLRGPALLDLKARWAVLTARQQLRARQAGVGVVIALFGYGLYTCLLYTSPSPRD